MRNDIERSPHVMVGGTESSSDLFARATARIQKLFRWHDRERMDQELTLRQQERQRERERIEEAFAGLRDEFTPSSGVRFRVFVAGKPQPLPQDIKEQIYMIGREALVNALRHSEATSIEAEVEYLPGRLRVVVRDNGRGIDEKMLRHGREARYGLMGMRECAESMGAQLQIWSRPGAGTELEISVPLHAMVEVCA